MEIYRTEEEQVAAIKKWWHKNGKLIITGVVMGFIVFFTWRGFQAHQVTQAKAASDIYQELITAAREDETTAAKTYAQQLFEQYQSSAYAGYAALFLAKYAAEKKDYPAAKEYLNWVIAHTDQQQIKHIARLRLARVLVTTGQLVEATRLLNINNPGKFSASYSRLKEMVTLAQGEQG